MTANPERGKAENPEDIPRLFLDFVNAGDFDGLATLFEEDAVLALPPGETTTGDEGSAAVFEQRFAGQRNLDESGMRRLPVLR